MCVDTIFHRFFACRTSFHWVKPPFLLDKYTNNIAMFEQIDSIKHANRELLF